MVTIHLTGRITEDGVLKVDLPEGLPPGEVQVTIEVENADEPPGELRPWTDEEIAELMRVEPKTGAEIVEWLKREGGWEHKGISSGADWVEEQRRKRRERNQW